MSPEGDPHQRHEERHTQKVKTLSTYSAAGDDARTTGTGGSASVVQLCLSAHSVQTAGPSLQPSLWASDASLTVRDEGNRSAD